MNLKAKYFLYKKVSIALIGIILFETIAPPAAFALTGGPSQPEVQSFEPVGTSETVDVFSGDFSYNIPLLDVGGYPINLSYHAGATMDEEASWVGLGWNINPGVIKRNMRSLPDDFSGDDVTKEYSVKDNNTFGMTFTAGPEIFGKKLTGNFGINFGLGMSYNNYKGVGFDIIVDPSISASKGSSSKATLGLGITASAESGVDLKPSLSFTTQQNEIDGKTETQVTKSLAIGLPINSRSGLKSLTIAFDKTSKSRNVEWRSNKLSEKDGWETKSISGSNGGSTLSFATSSYTPQMEFGLANAALSFNATIGLEFIGVHANANVTGYYSGQYLTERSKTFDAYGYLYSEKDNSTNDRLLDFNREKEGTFNKYTPNLPLTNFTYDLYSVSGQGIGGMYRPYRSEVGIIKDYTTTNIGGNINIPGIEIGLGNTAHGGLNVALAVSYGKSGAWENDNSFSDKVNFTGQGNGKANYEPFYFKQAGEKTAETDLGFFSTVGGFEATRVHLDHSYPHVPASSTLENQNPTTGAISPVSTITGNIYRNSRQRRNQTISFLTADEAKDLAVIKKVESYPILTESNLTFDMDASGRYVRDEVASKLRSEYPGHHISEITALRPDGARYIYGIPAYNNNQEEATFAINNGDPNCSTGLVSYNPGVDDSKNNKNGNDHLYSKEILPKYAHSYLLTTILSPDYVDLGTTVLGGAEGPSDDDLGSYTKINYTKVNNDYQWRVPFEQNQANYNEGLKSLQNNDTKFGDDKASYLYGSKELWYVHSIETRTHVAEFILDDRFDGYGVAGRNGGLGSGSAVKKLSRIVLYSKEDRRINGANAIPIKTVVFTYDNSLCQGIPNSTNGQGKLTLKEVYFTYGNSKKGRLNSYKFNYGYNPTYNLKGYDRWGNFKPNQGASYCGNMLGSLSTAEFPYVDQKAIIPSTDPDYDDQRPNRTYADLYAEAWNITSIELPSGGVLKVNYEADDYAYVQDRNAMQMFKISGSSPNAPTSSTNPNNGNMLYLGNLNYPFIYFKLSNPISSSSVNVTDSIKRYYIKDMSMMYYRFLVKVNGVGQDDKYEYVPGYAEIENYGVVPVQNGSDYTYGYLKLKAVGLKDHDIFNQEVNPISKQGWIFTRLHLPRVAYREPDPVSASDDGGVVLLNVIKELAISFKSLFDFIQGMNQTMRNEGFSQSFVQNKSWVRLYNPTGFKQGGGHRVNKVSLSDEWKNMFGSGQPNFKVTEYGQEYDYTTTNEYGNTISSGVASYEPLLGGDENPFRQPIFIVEERILAPDDRYYQEEPMGESFFPGASVGYNKVKVKSLQPGTGYVVHEFYTSKDFPTITKRTSVDNPRYRPNPLFRITKLSSRDYLTGSQGYTIELNDMHGKMKGQSVYSEANAKVSGITYYYKTKPLNGSDKVTLDNNVSTIGNDGSITPNSMVGVDADFIVDMRESSHQTIGSGLRGNLDAFFAFIGIVVPVPIPAFNYEKVRFRSAVTTKVINRYGLVDRVEAFDLGSSVQTSNILYDAETGEVLLTQTTNEFKDPVYSFTYPAHWGYDRMGLAYRNIGVSFNNASFNNIQNASDFFVPGDELLLYKSGASNYTKGWVEVVSANSIQVIDVNGTNLSTSDTWSKIKVIRSGRKNQQSTAIGAITTLNNNPIVQIGNGYQLSFSNVLNAGAIEFEEAWNTYCDCGLNSNGDYNPYVAGTLGNYRVKKSYTYLTDRTQSNSNNNVNIRKDGPFTTFSTFWKQPIPGAKIWTKDPTNWTWTSEVTEYSPHGMELENKDALNRFTSAVYGYGNVLPKGVANNAQHREVAVDDFEDYDYSNCANDHFSFKKLFSNKVSTTESHTGRKSIKVGAGSSVTVIKPTQQCQ